MKSYYQGTTSMRRPFLSQSGQGHSSVSSERDRAPRQKMRRAQRFSLETLESRCLLSNITGDITPYSSSLNPGDITAAGGKLWFAASGNANAIGMLDPSNPGSAQAFSQG